jgi:hypothetical protein
VPESTAKVLPKQARKVAREIQKSPQRAVKFLVKAGIINKSRKLTSNYR